MNFWTTINLSGATYSGGYYSTLNREYGGHLFAPTSPCDPVKAGVALEDVSDTKDFVVGLVLADPSEQEILALNNAVMYHRGTHSSTDLPDYARPEPDVVIALRPQDFSSIRALTLRGNFFNPNAEENLSKFPRYRKGMMKRSDFPQELLFIVKDGKFVNEADYCADCDKVLTRSAGNCSPPLKGCTKVFFDPEDRIVLPSADIYRPVIESLKTPLEAFRTVEIEEISATADRETGREAQQNNAQAAADTRVCRTTYCKNCILSEKQKCTSLCGGDKYRKPESCTGPFLESDIPMPSYEVRRALSWSGRQLPWELVKKLANNGLIGGLPIWKVDPDIRVGLYHAATKRYTLYQHRRGTNMYTDEICEQKLTAAMEDFGMCTEFKPSATCTLMERLGGLFISSGATKFAHCSGCFGSSAYASELAYLPETDSLWLMYLFATYDREYNLTKPYTIVEHYSELLNMPTTTERRVELEKLVRDYGHKNVRKAVKKAATVSAAGDTVTSFAAYM